MQRRGCQGVSGEGMGSVQETEAYAGAGKGRVGKSRGKMWVEEEFQGNGESAWGRHGKSGRE